MIIQQHLRMTGTNSKEELNEKNQPLSWEDSLSVLTLSELKQKLLELEREEKKATLGFLQMNQSQRKIARDQVAKIKKRLGIVREVITARFTY